jgi:hypothetical protein
MIDSSKGRPTLYRGIRMRSRLEASYAAHLDTEALCWWSYEPDCFASADGQWLPDFRLEYTSNPLDWVWVELKPAGLLKGKTEAEALALIAPILRRMETARSSSPAMILKLIFWDYSAGQRLCVISSSQKSGWRYLPDLASVT